MKYKCGVCGNDLIEKEPFCRNCGTKVDYDAFSKKEDITGNDLKDDSKSVINIYLVFSILAYVVGVILYYTLFARNNNFFIPLFVLVLGLAINVSGVSAYPRAYQLKATLTIGIIVTVLHVLFVISALLIVNSCSNASESCVSSSENRVESCVDSCPV